MYKYINASFFTDDPMNVAKKLLGKILKVKHKNHYLYAQIIETEAYYLEDKASHASLGYTEKRKALFMPPGTIYMYYARGGDSLNFSCLGDGNAVLIKSARPFIDKNTPSSMLKTMQHLNPHPSFNTPRKPETLCKGQTLLCRSLDLKVPVWDKKTLDNDHFSLIDVNYLPKTIIQTTRLGIPKGRDEELLYRFIDKTYAKQCTSNPLNKRNWQEGENYFLV